MVGHLRHVEEGLAGRVAHGLGIAPLPRAPASAAPVLDMDSSPSLQTIGKARSTLEGREVGILIAEGSDAKAIKAIARASAAAGARVRTVALRLGATTLDDGSSLEADTQLAGTPSVVFDAIAVVLSEAGARLLSKEAAAIDFVRDAFGHLKAMAVDPGARTLLSCACIVADPGVCDASDTKAFLAAARTRQWDREASVRTLA
jgi:catalase